MLTPKLWRQPLHWIAVIVFGIGHPPLTVLGDPQDACAFVEEHCARCSAWCVGLINRPCVGVRLHVHPSRLNRTINRAASVGDIDRPGASATAPCPRMT